MGDFSSDRSIQDYADSVRSTVLATANSHRFGRSSPTPFPRSNPTVVTHTLCVEKMDYESNVHTKRAEPPIQPYKS